MSRQPFGGPGCAVLIALAITLPLLAIAVIDMLVGGAR